MKWKKKKRLRDMPLFDLEKRLSYLASKVKFKETNEMKYIKYQIKKRQKDLGATPTVASTTTEGLIKRKLTKLVKRTA